jgi:hypothetical protein
VRGNNASQPVSIARPSMMLSYDSFRNRYRQFEFTSLRQRGWLLRQSPGNSAKRRRRTLAVGERFTKLRYRSVFCQNKGFATDSPGKVRTGKEGL